MKPKILIIVEGGIVQNVFTTNPTDIVLIDYDSDDSENPVYYNRYSEDSLFKNGEAYRLIDDPARGVRLSDEEEEVVEFLKKENF